MQLGDFEICDLADYAGIFLSYRNASVWSGPEVLKHPKKIHEATKQMDSYSFGLFMWEIWHESVPFDGDLKICQEVVMEEDKRPAIQIEVDDTENGGSDDDGPASPRESMVLKRKTTLATDDNNKKECSAPIAELIRACWKTEPSERLNFTAILEALYTEKSMYEVV